VAKVLIVDDSATDREVTVTALAGAGHVITQMDGGAKVFDAVLASPPDIILLDVVMADMNGFQVCRKLKKDDRTKGVPVVLVTSKSGDADKSWGQAQGADAYLTKPINATELKNVIKTLAR
jgi:CheY-like chemotaxis protein